MGIKHKAIVVHGQRGQATEWNDDHEIDGNVDAGSFQFTSFVIENLADPPANPEIGQIYYNTTDESFRVWNGTSWDTYSGVQSAVGVVPVGAVVSWLSSFPNRPALPDAFVACNGQVLADAESVFDGETIPNLNGVAGTQRFLRGSATSGTTGGSETHNHTPTAANSGLDAPGAPAVFSAIADANHLPHYYEVTWIMRIK